MYKKCLFSFLLFLSPLFAEDNIKPPFHTTMHPKGSLRKMACYSRFLQNERDIWIYTPLKYNSKAQQPYPLLIVFDGQAYTSSLIPAPDILDKLIAEETIPPVVALFISSIDQPKRNLELPCYKPFIEYLSQELIPWVRQNYNVSRNPHDVIIAGSSYGGLAAAYAALLHPELYGNVLSQSGAFWWKPNYERNEQWLVNQYRKATGNSVRFYLDVGNKENESYGPGLSSMLKVNQDFRDLLRHKGNFVYYTEFDGGHEYECWAKTFSKGLTVLFNWQQYQQR